MHLSGCTTRSVCSELDTALSSTHGHGQRDPSSVAREECPGSPRSGRRVAAAVLGPAKSGFSVTTPTVRMDQVAAACRNAPKTMALEDRGLRGGPARSGGQGAGVTVQSGILVGGGRLPAPGTSGSVRGKAHTESAVSIPEHRSPELPAIIVSEVHPRQRVRVVICGAAFCREHEFDLLPLWGGQNGLRGGASGGHEESD